VRLEQVTIVGYRSIRESFILDLDARVTVVLGANDHGKTNLLNGILHLNEDHPFDQENDLNLDYEGRADEFPAVSYSFRLSDEELEELLRRETCRIRLEAIAAFRAQLENEAKEAGKAAEAAEREKAKAAAALAGLKGEGEEEAEASSEETPPAGASALARAEAVAQEKTFAADAAREAADLAEGRARLARAEELKILAEADGVQDFDLGAAADATDAEAGKAAKNADRLRGQADEAQAAAAQAVATHGDGTDEAKKAQRAATSAEQQAKAARQQADRLRNRATDVRSAAEAAALAESRELAFAKDAVPPEPSLPKVTDMPDSVAFGRVGLDGELELTEPKELGDEAETYLRQRLPRVELIEPQERLPDSATPETIFDPDNDFMRGIFRYAGLEPEEWEGIFAQTDATRKRVAAANEKLNKTLRDAWSQGKELRFELDHREGEVDLLIDDPAVKQTYVRASRRSAGFTHFFALKTMLYAREQASSASSFIWLFDDPGIYLHPEGQHDLLQVLETLARANQLVYSTHSIFLISKNFPTRHRLLKKTAKGTIIDQKPYTNQ
jgi:predicted ATPase